MKELMIGDWVYIWDYQSDGLMVSDLYPAKIVSVIQGFPEEDMNIIEGVIPQENGYGVFSRPINDWEGIPLTEKFFEKNGFVADNSFYPYYKKYDSEDKRIIITDEANSGDGYWYAHVDNEDFDTIGACDVKYVHQFQQLLRLCEYEMDVVV